MSDSNTNTNTPLARKACPSDVRDEEWALVAPDLALARADAPQRRHDLRPWDIVYQQTRRWLEVDVGATCYALRWKVGSHALACATPLCGAPAILRRWGRGAH